MLFLPLCLSLSPLPQSASLRPTKQLAIERHNSCIVPGEETNTKHTRWLCTQHPATAAAAVAKSPGPSTHVSTRVSFGATAAAAFVSGCAAVRRHTRLLIRAAVTVPSVTITTTTTIIIITLTGNVWEALLGLAKVHCAHAVDEADGVKRGVVVIAEPNDGTTAVADGHLQACTVREGGIGNGKQEIGRRKAVSGKGGEKSQNKNTNTDTQTHTKTHTHTHTHTHRHRHTHTHTHTNTNKQTLTDLPAPSQPRA